MSASAKPVYLFANWKMYLSYDESLALSRELKKMFKGLPRQAHLVLFPSALAMTGVKDELQGSLVPLGAQNTYWVDRGGYTGEVSAAMYKAVGVEYALVGHSERRTIFHETDHDARQKIEALLAVGMTPVVCVGETLKERNNGEAEEVIEAQIRRAFSNLTWPKGCELIVAYEPVWAISKGIGADEAGKHCDDVEAEKMHQLIIKLVKNLLPDQNPVVLFGGSVRPNTVAYYLKQPSIDGVLVGAASTKFSSWQDIVTAALK